ncbi:MAG: Omp28-related outer membrane protein [Bacteroidales bacterium]
MFSFLSYPDINAQVFFFRLNVSVNGQGSVTKDPDLNRYFVFSTVTLTAEPASGWTFDYWSGDASSSANPLEIIMNNNKNIVANFSPIPPEAELSGTQSICAGESAELIVELKGLAPWTVTYSNGSNQFKLENIKESPHTFEVSTDITRSYTLVSVQDAYGNSGQVSGNAVITVYPLPVGGKVSGANTEINLGESTGTLTLSGHTGTIVRWQKRLNGGSWINIDNSSTSYSEVPSSYGTWQYRAVLRSGDCGTANSDSFSVRVNHPPVASNVEISGSLEIGNTLTGNYTYSDAEDDPQGESQFKWYRADDENGTNESVIPGETELSYTLTPEDAGLYLAFEVTPVAQAGTPTGEAAKSPYLEVDNSLPEVSDVTISGILGVGRVLYAEYEYHDLENDPESGTVIRWFRATDENGASEVEIHEGNEYKVTLEDEDNYLRIEVTPAAASGASPGETVSSSFYGPVINTLPTVSLTGPEEFCEGSSVYLVFTFTGEGPWTVIYARDNNEFTFTATSSPHNLSIDQDGEYKVLELEDDQGLEGLELGQPHIIKAIPSILISGDQYIESFEDDTGWTSGTSPGNTSNSWTFGLPDGDVFTSASAGENIWYTNMINRDVAEQSWVSGPCLDLSEAARPMIIIDLWKEFEADHDGAVLQYSEDNGNNWNTIGNPGTGVNWYNSTQIAGLPGGQAIGWTTAADERNSGWVETRHDLDELAGKTNIILRLAYGYDGEGNDNHGLAFDNIRIRERSRQVLLEHFTNAYDSESMIANEIVDSLAQINPDILTTISYHTPFPQADPINTQNEADPAARIFYYGVTSVPYSVMDGGFSESIRYDYSSNNFNIQDLIIRSLTDPLFNIRIDQVQDGNNLSIEVGITSAAGQEQVDLTLHVAVLETEITSSQAGLTGDQVFRNVIRKLLPDAGGTQLSSNWPADQNREFNFSWIIENVYNAENLALVVFIQDETSGEIVQTATSDGFGMPVSAIIPNLEVNTEAGPLFYPNPASGSLFIRFGERLETSGILEIYNLSGNLVLSEFMRHGNTQYQLDTGKLPAGTYLIHIKAGPKTIGSARIVILNN